jgi:mannose-6-phosphate isomerase-like protein (cupin superfamily)
MPFDRRQDSKTHLPGSHFALISVKVLPDPAGNQRLIFLQWAVTGYIKIVTHLETGFVYPHRHRRRGELEAEGGKAFVRRIVAHAPKVLVFLAGCQTSGKFKVMEKQFPYVTRLDIKFDHLELIDVPEMVKECSDKWFNQTLTKVNDSVVRVGIVEGEYHWHKHEKDDEFFFVLDGLLLIDLEDRTVALGPGQGFTISKGILHRTRAEKKTVMLMVENAGIRPTGD